MANHSNRNGLQDDDAQDQIGSNSSTPSGIATPQPDPADKRLPSIMHSYLQVGSFSGDLSHPSKSSTSEAPASEGKEANAHSTDNSDGRSSGYTSSSSSFVMMERDEASDAKPCPPDDKKPDAKDMPETLKSTNLPTPPCSFSCSLLQKDPETEAGSTRGSSGGSFLSMLKAYITSPGDISSDSPQSRRHASHPVSSVSNDPVLASHFSNPSQSQSSDVPSLPEAPLFDHEKPPVSISSENLARLTRNAADVSRIKNTPPLTPRAMSNESPQVDKRPVSSAPCSPDPSHQQPDEITRSTDEVTEKLNEAFPSRPSSSQRGGPPVQSLKGKLHVKITEARGLRPGFDPYVVCVFEWNEFISKSAQDEEKDSIQRQKAQIEADNEAGRAMAIPMNSRQSSHNSMLDGRDKGRMPVTDPHWNHEAVLYALRRSNPFFMPRLLMCVLAMSLVTNQKSTFPSTIARTMRHS